MALGHVQTISATDAGVTTISVSPTLTPGNAIVIVGIWDTSAAGMGGLTQTAGDTLTLRASIDSGGSYQEHYTNYAVAGGTTVFSFSWSSAQNATIYAVEISGMANTDAFDQSASTTQTTSSTISTGTTGSLAQADEIAIATIHGDGSGASSLVGFSNSFQVPSNGDQWSAGPRAALAYKIVASNAALETLATFSDSVVGTGLISTYKAAAAGADPRTDGRILIAPAGFS